MTPCVDTKQWIGYPSGMSRILEQLREAVEGIDESRNSLAKRSGVDPASLCRLVHGERGLSIGRAEQLAEALGFELVLRRKARKRKG